MINLILKLMENEALKTAFLKLANMSISASWLVLAILVLRLVLKKAPKWVNVLLWGIVAVRLICPFTIESALSLIPSTQTIPMNIEMAAKPAIDSGVEVVNSMVNPMIAASFTPNPAASANPLQIWIPLAAVIWAFGMVLMLLYTAISYWRLHRRIDTAVLYRDNIFQSEHVSSPFVLGIIKPKIYLPFNMNEQDIQHVVAHEQAHIRRKDHWWKPFGFLLLTIHWINPLMWMAYVLLCRDIELACDEKVIKDLDNEQRADYTQALVACSVNRRMIAACPLAFGEVGVKDRVKSVMNYRKPTFWIIIIAIVICIVVAVCFLTDPVNDSWIKVTHGAASVELECNFVSPINAYAIYEDIYENGELVSSEAIVFDNFQNEGGATPRRSTISLSVQPVNTVGGDGYTGELSLNYGGTGIAHMTRELPKEHYTDYVHVVTEMGNRIFKKQTITTEDNVTLYSIVLSTDLLGIDHKGLVARVQNNTLPQIKDTVVIYRLVTSENGEFFSSRNSSAATQSRQTLSLNDVIMLSQKGYDLTWADFEQFEYIETGFGLYIRRYEINELFHFAIGGAGPNNKPMYMHLGVNGEDSDAYIDIRDGGITEFISEHNSGSSEISTDDILKVFRDSISDDNTVIVTDHVYADDSAYGLDGVVQYADEAGSPWKLAFIRDGVVHPVSQNWGTDYTIASSLKYLGNGSVQVYVENKHDGDFYECIITFFQDEGGTTNFVSESKEVEIPKDTMELMIDPVVPVTVVDLITGEQKFVNSNPSIRAIQSLIASEWWTEGNPACDYDFKITVNEADFMYHTDCGTFTDVSGDRCITLDETQQEAMDRLLSEANDVLDRYWLTIGADGVKSIEIKTAHSSGGCEHADGSLYQKGERIWVECLDGYLDLRGVSFTALAEDGQIIWQASIPDGEDNAGFTHLRNNDWNVTNIP